MTRRSVQALILLAGLAGITYAIVRTLDETQEQVMPSPAALVAGGVLALIAIVSSARAWVALFSDLVRSRSARATLRGTFYLSQLTKYLPAGGVVQTASQLGLAPSAGVSVARAAVAVPASAVGAVAAGSTLAVGLAFDADQPAWVRMLAALGLGTVVLLHRRPMEIALDLARRVVHRIPGTDHLPTQRDIVVFYVWALVTIAALCAAFTVLLRSLSTEAGSLVIFSAFAASWVVGFLAVPIPAGVGVREAVLLGLLPGVPTAQVLTASLALRLLTIGTELVALAGNRLAVRRHAREDRTGRPVEELLAP